MTDDQHDDRHGQGTPPSGGRWDPLPQGDYDDGATAFVKLPEGGVDALLASADSPLAAPGHGYVPPQITVAPATTAGTDPAATGSWAMPTAPVDGAQWHDPDAGQGTAAPHQQGQGYAEYPQQDPYGGAAPYGAHAGHDDRFAYRPAPTGQWDFSGAAAEAAEGPAPEAGAAPGQDVTGQWSIPVAGGDLPDESGEFTQSSLAEQWGGTAPATLPGGAPAPWATQSAGQPWGDRTAAPTADPYAGAPAAPAPEGDHREPAAHGPLHDATPHDPAATGAYPDPGFREAEGFQESGDVREPGDFQEPDGFHGSGGFHEPADFRGPDAFPGHGGLREADASEEAGGTPGGEVPQVTDGAAVGPAGRPAGGADGSGPEGVREAAEGPLTGSASAGSDQEPHPGHGAEAGRGTDPARDPEAAGTPDAAGPGEGAGAPDTAEVPEAADVQETAELPGTGGTPEAGSSDVPQAADVPRSGPDAAQEAPAGDGGGSVPAEAPAGPTAEAAATVEAGDAGEGAPAVEAAEAAPTASDHAADAGEQASDEQAPDEQAPGEQPDGPGSSGSPDSADSAEAANPFGAQEEHPLASYVLRVNGADRPVTDAWIGESLLYVLRERLGLAGAKDGCSQGECGACNVQVDGRLVASCLVPAVTAAGSEVRTVEGLAADGQPSDVQRALARRGAVQCGFCVPGMAMTVHNLLEGNPAPTELETRQALCGNLCRCSGYRGVLEAVKEVVAEREAHAAESPETDTEEPRIPHQAGPGSGGVHASAFEPADPPGTPDTPAPGAWGPPDRPYGDQPHGDQPHGDQFPGDQSHGQDGGHA
ncbi:2Fe-2S iron-sulfur cluster-binding protein [Streptomyces rochei]